MCEGVEVSLVTITLYTLGSIFGLEKVLRRASGVLRVGHKGAFRKASRMASYEQLCRGLFVVDGFEN